MIGKLLLASIGAISIGMAQVDVEPQDIIDTTTPIVDVVEVEEVFECKVDTKLTKGGDILLSQEEGHIGDKVTAIISSDFLYRIDKVIINGKEVEIVDGRVEFELVEGNNTIEISFIVDKEQVQIWAEILSDAKNGDWKNIFNKDTLLKVAGWFFSFLLSSGILITFLRSKKISDKNIELIKSANDTVIVKVLTQLFEQYVVPYLTNLKEMDEEVKLQISTLYKCFLLAQEGTPEARLAIINELSRVQISQEEIAKQVKEAIAKEVDKEEQAKKEQQQAIKELEDTNNSIKVETKEDTNRYGKEI